MTAQAERPADMSEQVTSKELIAVLREAALFSFPDEHQMRQSTDWRAADALERLQQRAAELDVDAARYRFLRADATTFAVFMPRKHGHIAFGFRALDEAVDEARGAAQPAEPPSVDEQLAEDCRLYGASYARILADGTRTRLDPSTVTIASPPAESHACIFEDCDLDRAEGSVYCAGHAEQERQIAAEEAERRSQANKEST